MNPTLGDTVAGFLNGYGAGELTAAVAGVVVIVVIFVWLVTMARRAVGQV